MSSNVPVVTTTAYPAINRSGGAVLIGVVTPVQSTDRLTLNIANPTKLLGKLTLIGTKIYYTPPAGSGAVTDSIAYTITEQNAGTSALQSSAMLVEPPPTLLAVPQANPVEVAQQTIIGTVSVTLPHDALVLHQTAGLGTVSLGVLSGGVQSVLYTAPSSAPATLADTVSYTVTDQYGLTTSSAPLVVQLDPGPTYTPTTSTAVLSGQSVVIGTVTPGRPGDTITLTAENETAQAGLTLGPVQADGRALLIYTAPATPDPGGAEDLAFTLVDQNLGGDSFAAHLLVDAGIVLAATPPTGNLENGQTMVLGTVTPGIAGDTLSITGGPGMLGTLSLGPADASGLQQILYTAPAHILANATDSIAYEITDQQDHATTAGSATLQLDHGVVVTSTGVVTLAAGQSAVVDTIVAGMPGDIVTLSKTTASLGVFTLVQTVDGGTSAPNQYNVVYTETGAYSAAQLDHATFQVMDRAGGKGAGDSPYIRLAIAPRLISSVASVKLAPGQTVSVGTVAASFSGDALTIAAAPGTQGAFSLGPVSAWGSQSILYTAPANVAQNGTVALSYVITDQTGANAVTGSVSAVLSNPKPTLLAQAAGPLEIGQSTIIATASPGTTLDTLSLTQTGTAKGSLSLVNAAGVLDIVYTAPTALAASGSDHVTYSLTDEHGGSIAGAATVTLDAGPRLALATPTIVVKGQSTIIGTVSPGLATDVLSLTATSTTQGGSIALVGNHVVYTAASSLSASGTDTVSYTIADQHQDATVSGTATVKLLGGPALTGSDPIVSTTSAAFLDLTSGQPDITVSGANTVLLLEGTAAPVITDHASGLVLDIASSSVTASLANAGADRSFVVDLLGGVGGYASAQAAQAALVDDGHGGAMLALGGAMLALGGGGSIDLLGIAPASVAASHFRIG